MHSVKSNSKSPKLGVPRLLWGIAWGVSSVYSGREAVVVKELREVYTLQKISGQWFDSCLITKTDNWRYASIFFSSRCILLVVLFTETADHMVHSASSLPWKDLVMVAGQLNYVGNMWGFPNVRGWPQTTTVSHHFHQFLSCFVILHDHLPAVIFSKIVTCWPQIHHWIQHPHHFDDSQTLDQNRPVLSAVPHCMPWCHNFSFVRNVPSHILCFQQQDTKSQLCHSSFTASLNCRLCTIHPDNFRPFLMQKLSRYLSQKRTFWQLFFYWPEAMELATIWYSSLTIWIFF